MRLAGAHKLNLLFKTTRWSEAANGSLVLYEIGTTAERPTHAAKNQKRIYTRAPPKRAGRAFALLTKTYHGSRLGEGAQAHDAPVDKFRDWQEHTNSIFCSRPLAGLRQQMEVWFYMKEEPRLRSQHTRRRTRKNLHPRSSEARRERLCPLDKDIKWKSGSI